MSDPDQFGAVAGVLAIPIGVIAGVRLVAFPSGGGPTTATSFPGQPSHVNLTIAPNETAGWPRCSMANFAVPASQLVFTITDHDAVASRMGGPCGVKGTVNGVEAIKGTPYRTVPTSDVAHAFSTPALGANVLGLGQSVVPFTVDLTNAGTYS